MILYVIVPFILSLCIAHLLFNYLIVHEVNFNLIAPPNEDVPTHTKNIPLIGGTVIFAIVFLFMLLLSFLFNFPIFYFLGGFFPIGLLGFYKDRFQAPLNPFIQLFFQFLSILVLYTYWNGINNFNFDGVSFTIFFITSCILMNGFNFLDVMDGLAGCYTLAVFIVLGTACIYANNIIFAILVFVFIGTLLVFLKFNVTPAKIFMGDFGSFGLAFSLLFITISIFPLQLIQSKVGYAFIFFVPFFEFSFTFIRRLVLKKKPYSGDANHASLLLLKKGYSSTRLVLWMAMLTFITCAIGLLFLLYRTSGE